ncbi:MAG: DUF4407 domain-containing protein, partial [Acidobacteriota bacterium]|nr:DUF4407 domain-containing protein [Acidobacteriota bacterium]
ARSARENRVARFFLWCAGSDFRVLEQVPRSEIVKQIGYGTLVVIPAILALFAMTYAVSTLTENPAVYFGGGFVWSMIVFCFDRFIVSTFRKSESTINDITSTVFFSRLVFAAFVGVIVAHPLVMLYFNDTIEERLARDGRGKVAAIEAGFNQKRQALQESIDSLKTEVRDRERERNEYQAQLVDEIDGVISGRTTGIPGRGASAEEKKLQLQIAQQELDAARDRNVGEIAILQEEIVGLQRRNLEEQAGFEQSYDYLARAGALEALAAEAPHVNKVKWFLILFFVFVDTLPILFKGLTPRGPYDEKLQLAEYESTRTVQAERESLERVLYPYMVMSRENAFVADQSYRGVSDYARRYREFLDEMARHQDEFLGEWKRQQAVLAGLEDEELRHTQLAYMENLRASSSDVVNKAVERFKQSLAWESAQAERGAEAT